MEPTKKDESTPELKRSITVPVASDDKEPKEQLNWFWNSLLRRYGPDNNLTIDKDKLEWELEKHLSLYKDYSDFGIKAVGIFAAIVGGILSISFREGTDSDIKWFLLLAAFITSLVMGCIYIGCGFLWFFTSIKVKWIALQLRMIRFPDIVYLSFLLWVFGILFFVLAGGLCWLMSRV